MKTKASIFFILLHASNSRSNAHEQAAPEECPDKASLTTMARGGQYAAASISQQESYRHLFPEIANGIEKISLSSGQNTPIALADYGAADCLATRYLLEYIIDNVPNVKIDAMVNDQVSNDWDICAQHLSPTGKLKDLSSIKDVTLQNRKHIELFSNPGSFTTQLLPNGSIDISTSGTAFHWLSPSNLPRPGTFRVTSPNVNDHALLAEWKQHSANDWKNICKSRHAELKRGGYFFAIIPSMTVDGRETYDVLLNTIFDPLLDAWVQEGKLSAEVRRNIFAPAYARTLVELKAGMGEYFDIVKMDEVIMANPYLEGISLDKEQDRKLFAQRYVDSIFAWAHNMLLNAFGGDEDLVAKFKTELVEGVVARAEEFENDFVFASIVALKKNDT